MTEYSELALALAIGVLIGMERGWVQRGQPAGSRVAGVRTFGLLGVLGGVAGSLAGAGQPLVGAALIVGAVAVGVTGYRRQLQDKGSVSATTTITALLTLALGLLATSGFPGPALAAAAVVTFLLASRRSLHGLLLRLGEDDVLAVARFAIIAVAVLPLLPNRNLGPYGAWNPYELWLVVVVVCAVSFAGYVAGRMLGATRGVIATAAIGGLYSSTAVTVSLARRLATGDGAPRLLAAGIAVASATMFLRVLVLTAVLVPFALPRLAIIIGPGTLLSLVYAFARSRGAVPVADPLAADPNAKTSLARNPFELLPALGFALLVGVLSLLVRWAEQRFGDVGIATLIAISGSMDVDAAIVALRSLPQGTLPATTAGMILSLPVLINTLFKAGIVLVQTRGAGWAAAVPLLAAAATIPVVALIVWKTMGG